MRKNRDTILISTIKIPFSKLFYMSQKSFVKKFCLDSCTKDIFQRELKQAFISHKHTGDTVFMITHKGVINTINYIIDAEQIDVEKYTAKKLFKMPLIHENYNAGKICKRCVICEQKESCSIFLYKKKKTQLYYVILKFSKSV